MSVCFAFRRGVDEEFAGESQDIDIAAVIAEENEIFIFVVVI